MNRTSRNFKKAWLFIVGVVFLTAACQAGDTKSFNPLFSGMLEGKRKSSDCIKIDSYSVIEESLKLESRLTIYRNSGCSKNNKVMRRSLSADEQLAGVRSRYLVIDSGTGPDSREIELVDLQKPHNTYRLSYVMEPVFSGQFLSYYKPKEGLVAPKNCKGQQGEAEKWATMGLGIGIAHEMIFQAEDARVVAGTDASCYPIQ